MARPPVLDGRRAEEIRDRIISLAPYYLDTWDPESDDVGSTLVELFAEMAAGLTERVDQAPRKHQAAFYQAMGFDRQPPQAATVPVWVTIDADAPGNVAIPGGTEAIAEVEGEEEIFRIAAEDAFEATPAQLTHVFSVDPDGDHVFAHHDAVAGSSDTRLFAGDDLQANEVYIGHPERLALSAGGTIALDVESSDALERLEWEYFGESADGEEGWHTITTEEGWDGAALAFSLPSPIVETTVDGIENAWIRARLPSHEQPVAGYDIEVDDVTIMGESYDASVDTLFANDLPQSTDETVYPFGAIPQQRDTFYIACQSAFTKPGAAVWITFEELGISGTDLRELWPPDRGTETANEGGEDEPMEGDAPHRERPRLSWEYFNGSSWQRIPSLHAHDAFHSDDGAQTVSFTVPPDLESTAVNGEEAAWIRVRLAAGNYVKVVFTHDEDSHTIESARRIDGDPPSIGSIAISYAYEDVTTPTHLLAKNALEYSENLVDQDGPHRPFETLPDRNPAVYFGVDAPLRAGPVQLFIDLEDRAYPGDFDPRVRWEHLTDPETDTWQRIASKDDTGGFTSAGIVSLSFAEATIPSRRFGEHRHWVRARLRGSAFEREDDSDESTPPDRPDLPRIDVSTGPITGGFGSISRDQLEFDPIRARDPRLAERFVDDVRSHQNEHPAFDLNRPLIGDELDIAERIADSAERDSDDDEESEPTPPCRTVLETAPGATGGDRAPPNATGIYLNTGLARNVTIVEDEIVGSSDGTPDLEVSVARPRAMHRSLMTSCSSLVVSSPPRSTASGGLYAPLGRRR